MDLILFILSTGVASTTAALAGEALNRKNYAFASFLGICTIAVILLYKAL